MFMPRELRDTSRSNYLIEASPELRLLPLRYPNAQVLFLPAINESVPVYEGKVRLLQDVVVSADRTFHKLSHPDQDNCPERDALLPGLREREMLLTSEIWMSLGMCE